MPRRASIATSVSALRRMDTLSLARLGIDRNLGELAQHRRLAAHAPFADGGTNSLHPSRFLGVERGGKGSRSDER